MRLRLLPLTALLLAACVSNPPRDTPVPQASASAFDPVGTFEFNAEMMGQTQAGELRITRTEGKLGGTVSAGSQTIALTDVKLDNRKLTANGAIAQGGPAVQFTFDFQDNDTYTGTVNLAGMGEARLWGKRKPQ